MICQHYNNNKSSMANKFVPLRSFIFDRLYNPSNGYFCRKDFQVGELASPIDFKTLIGFDDYQQQLFKRYPKNAWLTPSQIFKPYYGMSLANYIEQAQERYKKANPTYKMKPIRIVEAGAGTGSAAESILHYFQNHSIEQYKTLEYHIVEISPSLCAHMSNKLKKKFPYLFETGRLKILNKDIKNYTNPNRCYTIFLEVLDNLPHDKVIKNQNGVYDRFSMVNLNTNEQKYQDIKKDQSISQCLELYLKAEKFKEKTQGVQSSGAKKLLDRLAVKFLQKYYMKKPKSDQLFLPTHAVSLFKSLKTNLPEAHLIMSDFDSLVTKIGGINAPIISFKGESSTDKKDYETYLVDCGAADIFFPVNFNFMKYLHGVILGGESDVLKSYDFFQEFGFDNWTESQSGFNPLKEDFSNTTFLVTRT